MGSNGVARWVDGVGNPRAEPFESQSGSSEVGLWYRQSLDCGTSEEVSVSATVPLAGGGGDVFYTVSFQVAFACGGCGE